MSTPVIDVGRVVILSDIGSPVVVNIGPPGTPLPGGSSAWGGITGTLSDQTDLQAALDAKEASGTAAAAVSAHAAAVDPHGDRAYTDSAIATKLDDLSAGNADTIVTASADGTLLSRAAYTIATLLAAARDRATHTGTQLAATISDFASAVGTLIATHAGLTSTHGVSGAIVGTTDTQTLTGKTISGSSNTLSAIALSSLSQSGASSGQVATWNGSAWAPATPSGGASNTRWIGAGELIPRVTNGAGIDGEELATNKANLDYLAFDPATQEYAQASFAWPSGFSTYTARFFWTVASGSGAVVWSSSARCHADDAALDQSMGTAQTVTDTLLAANDAHISSATSAITPAGTVAAGNLCIVQVSRVAADGSDTLAVDARLIGVLLEFSA